MDVSATIPRGHPSSDAWPDVAKPEPDRAAADDFDDKKRSLLGPISEEHVKEGIADAISSTHEQIEGGNLAEIIIKKSFIEASTDEPQTFKQKLQEGLDREMLAVPEVCGGGNCTDQSEPMRSREIERCGIDGWCTCCFLCLSKPSLCCCLKTVVGVLLTLLLTLWLGLVAPLWYRAEASLCGLNITDETSTLIAIEFSFGIYNPSMSDIVVPGAQVALVADAREPEAVPLELEGGARKSVDYGALVACELSDVALPAGRSSPMRLTCALSQYASQRQALSTVANTLIDGSGKLLLFSMRYHARVGALGLDPFTIWGGRQFSLGNGNVTATVDPNRTHPEPSLPSPPSPPSPQPALLGGRFNDRHCGGKNVTKFDWQLFITGTENVAERRRLFSVCRLALCERGADFQVAPETDAARVSAACAWALSDWLSTSRLVGRVEFSVFNPLSVSLSIDQLDVSLALSPSSAVWADTAAASVVDSGRGSVLACSLLGSVKLRGASWTGLTLECAIGPALANLTADYQAGATSSLNAAFSFSASAFGVSFSDEFTTAFNHDCLQSTADVRGESASATPPLIHYIAPALVPDCAGEGASVDAVEPWSSEKANATLAALECLVREAHVWLG